MSSRDLKILFVALELLDIFLRAELGHFGGNGTIVMLGGAISRPDRCQPA
jgi:hypothetical protein